MPRVNYEKPVDQSDTSNDPVKIASVALVNFIRELYWICEVGFVTQLVSLMLQHATFALRPDCATLQARLRLDVIKLLSEHEAWVQLNFPNFADTNTRQLKLTKQFTERHYLAAELLRMIQFALVPLAKKSNSTVIPNPTPVESNEDMIKLRNSALQDLQKSLLTL